MDTRVILHLLKKHQYKVVVVVELVHLVQKIILKHQKQNTHLLKLQIIQFLAYQTTLYQAHQ